MSRKLGAPQSEDLILKYFIRYGITALKKHAPHHQIEHLVNSLLSAGDETCGEVYGEDVWGSSFDAIAKTPYFTGNYD